LLLINESKLKMIDGIGNSSQRKGLYQSENTIIIAKHGTSAQSPLLPAVLTLLLNLFWLVLRELDREGYGTERAAVRRQSPSFFRQTRAILREKGVEFMVGILWTIVVVLFVLWLLGFIFHIAGGLIHIVLVIAIIVAIYNFVVGSRRRTL
jgi:hypothetical protein